MTEQERQERYETAKAAAGWWARKICGPLTRWQKMCLEKKEKGTDTPFDHLLFPRLDALPIFDGFLTERIYQKMDDGERLTIECDWGPKGILLDAARVAGISDLFFRFRAEMTIEKNGKVEIRDDRSVREVRRE